MFEGVLRKMLVELKNDVNYFLDFEYCLSTIQENKVINELKGLNDDVVDG